MVLCVRVRGVCSLRVCCAVCVPQPSSKLRLWLLGKLYKAAMRVDTHRAAVASHLQLTGTCWSALRDQQSERGAAWLWLGCVRMCVRVRVREGA